MGRSMEPFLLPFTTAKKLLNGSETGFTVTSDLTVRRIRIVRVRSGVLH